MELDELARALQDNLPKGATAVGEPRRVAEPGRRLLFARYAFENGPKLERGVALTPELVVRADLLVWPDFYEIWSGTTEPMVRSATITGP